MLRSRGYALRIKKKEDFNYHNALSPLHRNHHYGREKQTFIVNQVDAIKLLCSQSYFV